MGEFLMPSLGSDMERGTLVEWLVHPGDEVRRGDILAVVETVKGAIEIEVFDDGRIERLLVAPGADVPVGTPLALITGVAPQARMPTAPAKASERETPSGNEPAGPTLPGPPASAPKPSQRRRASPAARRRAATLGVDLATLAGRGPDEAVLLADVEGAARTAPRTDARPAMQAVIGAAMERSKREIPHYYLSLAIDLEPALGWLEANNLERPVTERLIPGVILLRAAALALRHAPELNGHWRDGAFRAADAAHVGVAISLRGGGLVAPALHDADCGSLAELMAAMRDLVKRARAGSLRSSELSDGTMTVSSLGEEGADVVFPIIYPPQVAIVGFGGITRRPWVTESGIVVRRVVTASLAGDHRVSNGQRGAAYLMRVASLLQSPEDL